MRARGPALLLFVATLLVPAAGGAGEDPLKIEVSPRISAAPSIVRVRSIVAPRPGNRGLEVTVDGERFFSSSYVPLDGSQAARVTELTIKNVPGGEHEVVVTLLSTDGGPVVEHRTIIVQPEGREF